MRVQLPNTNHKLFRPSAKELRQYASLSEGAFFVSSAFYLQLYYSRHNKKYCVYVLHEKLEGVKDAQPETRFYFDTIKSARTTYKHIALQCYCLEKVISIQRRISNYEFDAQTLEQSYRELTKIENLVRLNANTQIFKEW